MTPQLDDAIIPAGTDFIYALAAPTTAQKAEKGSLFAARASGLYRSKDGGRTWQEAFATLFSPGQHLPASSVALSPDFDRDHQVFAGVPGGVVRSSDGGKTWRSAIFPPPAPVVVSLVVSPNFSQDDTLFAGTAEDGVFISTDGGRSWAAWNFGLLDANILCLAISPDFARDETLYAGATTGLFVSTNGGRAWREVELPADMAAVLSLAVSPGFAGDHTAFAGTEENGLFRGSPDLNLAGMRWEPIGAGLIEPVNSICLAPDFPQSPELLALQGGQLCWSGDGGATFRPWERPGLAADLEVLALAAPGGFSPQKPVLVGGVDGEVRVV
jgi:hypothetical protein